MDQVRRRGRPPISSADQVQMAAMRLFVEQGFDQTSMTEVAAAAGVGRSTLFRYFPSKADIVWAGFDEHLRALAARLAAQPGDLSVMASVLAGVVEAFAAAVDEQEVWLQRFQVLQRTPALAPDVAVRWLTWARTVAEHVASRMETSPDDAVCAAVGGAVQAAFTATLQTWYRKNDFGSGAVGEMRTALRPVCDGLERFLGSAGEPPASG